MEPLELLGVQPSEPIASESALEGDKVAEWCIVLWFSTGYHNSGIMTITRVQVHSKNQKI